MITKHILIFTIYVFIIVTLVGCNLKEKKKLQIGIKKRVDNCSTKSKRGDLLHVHYKGVFLNGKEFDSSKSMPFTFTLGSGQVIKGWDQGLMGMCIGELRKLVIPPELGYGSSGVPPKIPKDSVLIFHVELVDIEHKEKGD